MKFIRQGATHKVVLGPAVAVANGYVPVTNLTLSGADEAEVILHDNGTVVDISGYTWAAITTADGYYHLTLQSAISGTVGHVTVVVNDDSLILPLREDFTVVEEVVYDALYAASAPGYVANAPVNVAQWNGSNVASPATAGYPAVTLKVGTGTGEVNLSSGKAPATIAAGDLANNSITAAAVADGAIDSGAVADGALTSAKFANGAFDAVWTVTTRELSAFSASFKTGYALSSAGVQAIWDAATSALTTVGSIGKLLVDNINATISSRSSHAATDIVSNGAITTSGGAVSTVTTTGTATNLTNAPTNGDMTATMKASVNAEVLDVLNVDTYPEPGQGTPAATLSLAAKINYLFKNWRNRKTQTSSQWSLYNDDATTVDHKATVSDDGTTAGKTEIATGP